MNKKEAFLRYLNGECTSRDFNLAREYAAHASLEEKELFNQTNNEIAKTGLEKLVSTQPFDLAVVDDFLMKQGVSKEYFQLLLHYFLRFSFVSIPFNTFLFCTFSYIFFIYHI